MGIVAFLSEPEHLAQLSNKDQLELTNTLLHTVLLVVYYQYYNGV